MRRHLTLLAAVAVGLIATAARADEILNIGDPAPKLAVSGWVKGDKVEAFEPGKTYVVEFWATWCGPCRVSIPHLTELAHKYKDRGVRFIGVDVWETDVSKVRPFVDEMGARMDYNVALDTVPEDAKASEGAMAKTWMAAAEENGIPTAMDGPLGKVTAGDWDPKELAARRLAAKQMQKKLASAQAKILGPYRSRDYRATLSAVDEVTAADPKMADELIVAATKLDCLCRTGATDEAVKLGERLLEKFHDEPIALNNAFFNTINLKLDKEPDPRIARLALQAARRADELTRGARYSFLDTLAVAQYRTGDAAAAIATEEKALRLLDAAVPDEKQRSSPGFKNFRKQFEDTLATFRKAAAKPDKP